MKSEVYKEKVNTRDELVARIMKSAALIKQERHDDIRRATHTVVKRVEKYIEVDGGIFDRHCCRTVPLLRRNGVPSQPWHRSAAVSVHCTKSCIYSQKLLLRMGEFVARNMRGLFKKINFTKKMWHLVGCLPPPVIRHEIVPIKKKKSYNSNKY